MNPDKPDTCTKTPIAQHVIPCYSELGSIYSSTFPHVGQKFLDSLMQQITVETKSTTTLMLQLLPAEEYKELSRIYQNQGKKFNVINHNIVVSSPPDILDEPQHPTQPSAQNLLHDQFLLIRACFSDDPSMEFIKQHTIIPLSTLNASSPYLKALLSETKILSMDHKVETEPSVYPEFQHFVSTRLESFDKKDLIKGIICVLDKQPMMDSARLDTITTILNAVHDRCVNEINQMGEQERLMSARDLASLDAENKLKFLADMSHEIRTPMNAVIALTDLLLQERSTLNIEQIEHLEVIQTSGSHLLTIINDILDISKLNHDPKFKLESRRFSLRKCLKDTLNMARHQASMSQQNKMVYVLECPPDKDDNLPLPQLISQLENSGILLRPLHHKKGKTVLPVIWKIDSDVPDHLLGDTMRLTQIMLNLCSNAVKFTKQGGIHIHIKRSTPTPLRPPHQLQNEKRMSFKERYEAKIETMWSRALQERRERNNSASNPLSPPVPSGITTSPSGLVSSSEEFIAEDYFGEKAILEISVTDTGIGIPADRLPKLFKSFSQIDISTARRYGGTGLGLAISSTLVNRMGGCVWVESEENTGSRFALTLPMTVAPRTRNYSNDSTPMAYGGSPSSPGSTISDSSGSVHSSLGGNASDTAPSLYTFTTPVANHPGYFPATTYNQHPPSTPPHPHHHHHQQQQQQQQQQQSHRPMLPRTTHQQLFGTEPYSRSETSISHMIHTTGNDHFSPMAEDGPLVNPTTSSSSPGVVENKHTSGGNNGTARKTYTDLLSPATRNTRVAITKQHYHNRKPQIKEENLAKIHPLRILLAEDNILNQKIAISILKRLGYVDVAIANNGKEVLSLMKTSVFDVIFMDLYMPEMDGLEVTREIIKERAKQKVMDATEEETESTDPSDPITLINTVDVYIIALTASASREDRQICIDAGMNDFISKPFTMTEMKSALKTCANKRKKRRKLAQKQLAEMEEVLENNNDVIPSSSVISSTDDPMLDVESPSHIV